MSIPLNINGAVFEYPVNFDEIWGVNATGWAQAVTNGMLQKQGGSFPLTANVNFGASFGILSAYFSTRSANPSTSGTVRLSSADAGIGFRNNANSGNLIITTDASDNLLYNGNIIAFSAGGPLPVSRGGTGDSSLTPYAVLAGGTSSTSPVQSVASVGLSGQVLTSNGAGMLPTFQNTTGTGTVNSGTQFQLAYYATTGSVISGLTLISANKALTSDANGLPVASTTTATELGYVSGVTSAIQPQINSKVSKAGDTMSGALNMGTNKIVSLANGTVSTDAAAFGQIKIVQIISFNTSTTFSTTNATFTNTNVTASITPTSASNKIIVWVSGQLQLDQTTVGDQTFITINRSGMNLGDAFFGFGFIEAQVAVGVADTGGTPVTFFYLDQPVTTSMITYTVQIRNQATGRVGYFPKSAVPCSIILVEVVA